MKTNNNSTDKLFRRLQLKFTLIVSGICIALMTVCMAGAISASLINMEVNIVSVLARALNSPISAIFPDKIPDNADASDREKDILPECAVAVVYCGEIYAVKYDYLTDGEMLGAIIEADNGNSDISIDGRRYRLASDEKEWAGDVVKVYAVYDYTNILQNFLAQVAVLAFALVGLGVVVSLLTYMISGNVLSPARESLIKQKDLIANAGHELKTPVTIINANLDVINADSNLSIEENRKWLSNIELQTKRMSALITELLEMSSFESAEYRPDIKTFDLAQLVEGACLSFEAACFERSIALEMSVECETIVTSDEKAWGKLVGILFDNAVKYSEDGGRINVSLKMTGVKKKKQVEFAVTNGGATIPPEEIDRIFDRFHKVGNGSNSFGLGLAMAKTICLNMGGKISCQSADGVTTFTVSAPAVMKA